MENKIRDKMLNMRLDAIQELYIEKAKERLEEFRIVGTKKITKTEVVLVLLSMGMEVFNSKYGNPMATKKKAKAKK
jgi:hypothetical protein